MHSNINQSGCRPELVSFFYYAKIKDIIYHATNTAINFKVAIFLPSAIKYVFYRKIDKNVNKAAFFGGILHFKMLVCEMLGVK